MLNVAGRFRSKTDGVRNNDDVHDDDDYDDNDVLVKPASAAAAAKICASCSANKTPLWRDAEDGTPLCNACGIRSALFRLVTLSIIVKMYRLL